MNYYGPRELQNDGKGTGLWHYTVMNDGHVRAIGHCSRWDGCPKCSNDKYHQWGYIRDEKGELVPDGKGNWQKCPECEGRGLVEKKNPCPGHKTPDEACEHYKQYKLEGMKIRGPKTEEWPKNKCAVEGCNETATMLADVGHMDCYELCPAHANRETVEKLFSVGECWSSY